ncbi:nuclear mRNA export protein SAC3 [Marchantia polymorpha subsp. ruderalis]
MDDNMKRVVFGSQTTSPKLNPASTGNWTAEESIVFGPGASGKRSAEGATASDRGGPGGPGRRERGIKQPQLGPPQVGKGYFRGYEQPFAPQQVGKGYAKSPDQQQFGQQQLGKVFAKSPEQQQFSHQQLGRGFSKSPEQQQFPQQQLGKGFPKSPEQQQFPQQQLGKGFFKSPDQQQFPHQQLGKGFSKSPDQQQFPQQQLGKGFSKSPDQQQFPQQQLGKGFSKSPDQQQFPQQQLGKGFSKSPDQQQFAQQQLGKGYTKSPDQQLHAQQQLSRGYAKSTELQQSSLQQPRKGYSKHQDQYEAQQVSKGYAKSPDQQREEEAAKERRRVRFGAEGRSTGATQRLGPEVANVERQTPNSSPGGEIGTMLEPGSSPIPGGNLNKREMIVVRRPEVIIEDSSELDGLESLNTEAILGICPDMCPEIEREERERKGDLDRFERVEGDRNQTSIDLAVKKYTRTAEKSAVLIRPLPVLKSTMTHLLSLLERDHEDDLLSVHNFLWDRMRAVRMDLRMQHIFGEDSITMHEQMIRFHILAMHELCEYVQGEAGVSEGFNAHLNIEQMNKTSVDLFQMYEDHVKQGISVPSEAEFRGYYALLKLDKHPGYRVEPAELSLDLAKMTPEIRRSPQVLFARDVARACRGNNYVAFFRLARQATYLQACLMHAHFAKLRTQALASLYSGLLKNQGIPLSTVVDWLGMEGENIEDLVKYHGFSMKSYEEDYMVKEGPFLNKERDFPTSRSQLVEAKRSAVIAADVQSGGLLPTRPDLANKLKKLVSSGRSEYKEGSSMIGGKLLPAIEKGDQLPIFDPIHTFVDSVEEDMPDYVDEEEQPLVEIQAAPLSFVTDMSMLIKVQSEEEVKQSKKRRMEEPHSEAEEHEIRRLRHEADAAARRAASQALAAEAKRQEEKLRGAAHKAEADAGKQWRWFRKWRRRAAAKALERQQKLERAETALNTLSLGLPLVKTQDFGGDLLSVEDRHYYLQALVEEQARKLQEFWAPINIPKLVMPILHELNRGTRFLHWNLLLSTEGNAAGNWIRTKVNSKLLSNAEESYMGVELSTISADGKIIFDRAGGKYVGLWYSTRELVTSTSTSHSQASFYGTSGLVFVVKENESVAVEQARLHTLAQAVPDGVSVPLLVISTEAGYENGREAEQSLLRSWDLFLKTDEVSREKISKHKLIYIGISPEVNPDEKCYFSGHALTDGLLWLAYHCPRQPQLRPVHLADLVKEHLDDHLRLLLRMYPRDVKPEHCITVYNKALEKAVDEIEKTARSIPLNWPPDSPPRRKLEGKDGEYMPSLEAWNHSKTLELAYAALISCRLPAFPSVPSFDTGISIISQKMTLESVLQKYLSIVEGTSTDNPTMRWEVNGMVQRGCTIDWSKTGNILVPRWARIFQAIFATRLILLDEMQAALVYVSRVEKRPPFHLEKFEKYHSSANQALDITDRYCNAEPLLDDLIGQTGYEDDGIAYQGCSRKEEASPPQQMRTAVREETPTRSARNSYQTQFSTPETLSLPMQYRGGYLEESQKEVKVSPISRHVTDWLISRTGFDSSKRMQLALTDSELFLDDMMEQLDLWNSRPAGDHAHGDDFPVTPPLSNANLIELSKCDKQISPKEELGYYDSAFDNVIPHSREKKDLGPWALKLELTESEILLGRMVAEFETKTSEGDEAFPTKIAHGNGDTEHVHEYKQSFSERSRANLLIS